jgi:hypothetical protein
VKKKGALCVEFHGGPRDGERIILQGDPWHWECETMPQRAAGASPDSHIRPNRHLYARTSEVYRGATIFEWQGIQ